MSPTGDRLENNGVADKNSIFITVKTQTGGPYWNARVSIMQAGFAGGRYDEGTTGNDGTVVLHVSAPLGEKVHVYVNGKEMVVGPLESRYGITMP